MSKPSNKAPTIDDVKRDLRYVTFHRNGATVDVEAYLSTPEGQAAEEAILNSAQANIDARDKRTSKR